MAKIYRVWAEAIVFKYLDVEADSAEEARKIAENAEEGAFTPTLDGDWEITDAIEQ